MSDVDGQKEASPKASRVTPMYVGELYSPGVECSDQSESAEDVHD